MNLGLSSQKIILMLVFLGTVFPPGADLALGQDTAVAGFPKALLGDAKALPTRENGLWLLGGTVLAIVVYQFEDPAGATNALDQGVWDGISDFGNIWGDIRVQAPLALGTWAVGSWAGHDRLALTGYDLSRGLLLSYATVSLIKVAVNRTRPNGDDYSFPSGHTASAFTTAGVVSQHYGGWAGGVAIGLGVMTAMGRMEDMKHFASDVVVGATIGWIIGRTVARKPQEGRSAWQLVPLGNGLAVAGHF